MLEGDKVVSRSYLNSTGIFFFKLRGERNIGMQLQWEPAIKKVRFLRMVDSYSGGAVSRNGPDQTRSHLR